MKKILSLIILIAISQSVLHARTIEIAMHNDHVLGNLNNVNLNIELGDTIEFRRVQDGSSRVNISGIVSQNDFISQDLIYRFIPSSIGTHDFVFENTRIASGTFHHTAMEGIINVIPPTINLNGYEIAHYSLDGHANDISCNNHNGNLFNPSPSEDRFGNPNGALSFTETDFVAINNAQFFNGDAMSFSFWFKLDQVNSSGTMVKFSNDLKVGFKGNNLIEVSMGVNGRFDSWYSQQFETPRNIVINTNPVPLNVWHNVIVSCKRMVLPSRFNNFPFHPYFSLYGGNYFEIYLNGTKVYSTFSSNPSTRTIPTYQYSSGWHFRGLADYFFERSLSPILGENFVGHLDDLRVWSTAVNSLEAQAIYNNQSLSVNESSLTTFSCYPNPTKDVINITGEQQISSVVIYDMNGKKLIESTEPTVDVSSLSTGVYQVLVNGAHRSRFIKD